MEYREYINTTDFKDILNSIDLNSYVQDKMLQSFPLANILTLRNASDGKFDITLNEPTVQDLAKKNKVYEASESSDFPVIRFDKGNYAIGECTEFKEAFVYSTKLLNTSPSRVQDMTDQAAGLIGANLNRKAIDTLANGAGYKTGFDLDFTVNPAEALQGLSDDYMDIESRYEIDTILVRAEKYNVFSKWLMNTSMGAAYSVNEPTEKRVSSYIGISISDLPIQVLKIPKSSSDLMPSTVDYIGLDTSQEFANLYNGLESYQLPTELASQFPTVQGLDVDNLVIAAQILDNSNISQYNMNLLASLGVGIRKPGAMVTGLIQT